MQPPRGEPRLRTARRSVQPGRREEERRAGWVPVDGDGAGRCVSEFLECRWVPEARDGMLASPVELDRTRVAGRARAQLPASRRVSDLAANAPAAQLVMP